MSKNKSINLIAGTTLYEGATTKGNTLDIISYDNWTSKRELDHSLILGDLDCVREVENEKGLIEIIIDYKKKNYDDLFRIVDRCHSVYDNVKISSSLLDIIHQTIPMNNNSNIQLINASNKYKRKSYLLAKRVLDIIGSIALMILFIPVFIPISILSFLSFTGPVFFVQDRIGKKGRIFRFIKFRTMRPMVGEDIVRQQEMIEFINSNRKHCKIINQLRITPLGKILRKFSLDELPQLYNVLKGDMSLVGPRPCLLYEYEQFEPWQKKRAAVKPGCTGVWQIFGRKEVSFKESIILDLFYVYNTSLPFDLKLISLTLPIMILGKTGE